MVDGLLLAAGKSSRMGTPKAFLELEGEPLLIKILRSMRDGGVPHAVVVVGSETDPHLVSRARVTEIIDATALTRGFDVRVVIGAPDGSPIDSIRAGLAAIDARNAVLLWPVDHPFAEGALVRDLLSASDGASGRIVRPIVGGHGAHPVLFGATVARELAGATADGGAAEIVHRIPSRVVAVHATDARLTAPLNTPNEARALGVLCAKS